MRAFLFLLLSFLSVQIIGQVTPIDVSKDTVSFTRVEVVKPVYRSKFRPDNCEQRVQGGNPRTEKGYLQFDGTMDGKYQVDPQIAVGGGYVLHGANYGQVIYDTLGNYIEGVKQNCLLNGIDPKMYFDIHHNRFVMDVYLYWDSAKVKPVHISVSESDNPTKGWYTYPVSCSDAIDGGGIGYSTKWIAYTYPGGKEETMVLPIDKAKNGEACKVYHFGEYLGQPVFGQDENEGVYFVKLDSLNITVTKIVEVNQEPKRILVMYKPHAFKYSGRPLPSAQKGSAFKNASGDRNPKNAVLQNDCIWFSHTVNVNGRAGVQWHQINLEGATLQSGLIASDTTNYIQTTLAVNKDEDVLVGFQEVNENMWVSPRMAFRKGSDPKNTLQPIVEFGSGKSAIESNRWGDYSGSIIDGLDLKTLWTIQSIASDHGTGETRIIKVPFH